MADEIRHIDPPLRPGAWTRMIATVATSRIARISSRTICWKLDPMLLRATHGRVATTLVIPTALLETRGARTGATRRNAVIYFHDADSVIIAASNAGASRHPAWYHNLCAHPAVTLNGVAMNATVVTDAGERARLWELADRVFPAYANYRCQAAQGSRTIPLIRLNRAEPESAH